MNIIIIEERPDGQFEIWEPHGCKGGQAAGLGREPSMAEAKANVYKRYRAEGLRQLHDSAACCVMEYAPKAEPERHKLPEMTGIDLIALERKRHPLCGYNTLHDDEHGEGEIAKGAICYVRAALAILWGETSAQPAPPEWFFHDAAWKPSKDPIRNLVKAGSMIAAEIDRLQRLADKRT